MLSGWQLRAGDKEAVELVSPRARKAPTQVPADTGSYRGCCPLPGSDRAHTADEFLL